MTCVQLFLLASVLSLATAQMGKVVRAKVYTFDCQASDTSKYCM